MRSDWRLALALMGACVTAACGGNNSPAAPRAPSPSSVTPLAITTTALNEGVRNTSYSMTLQATGGSGTRTWSIVAGGLAPGLQLSPGGIISGTPTQAGLYNPTIEVRDSGTPQQIVSTQFALRIWEPLVILTSGLPTAYVNEVYATTLDATGGNGGYTWNVATGSSPPPGITLSSSGQLGGTPTAAGTFAFVVEVRDGASASQVAQSTLSMLVTHRAPLVIETTSPLPSGVSGQPYTFTFQASGGLPPLRFYWINAFSSCCFTLSSDGTLSALFRGNGDFYIDVAVDDSAMPPQTVWGRFHFRIDPGPLVMLTSTLPDAQIQKQYSFALDAAAGTPPYTWAVISGALPPGIMLDATGGRLQGQPTEAGEFDFTLEVTDSSTPAQKDSAPLRLKVLPPLGRNDSIPNATPITNGTWRASISPYADPPDLTSGNPDRDYYRLTAQAGTIVTIETYARRQNPNAPNDPLLGSRNPLDTVIEIVSANGQRFQTCIDPVYDNSPPASLQPRPHPRDSYQDPCMNDDIQFGVINDSRLEFRVPGNAGETLTFYIHVFDWSGHAAPDMVYDLVISGAN